MTSFDCSQPLEHDAICHLALQKDSTLVIPSYPQILRRPKILHIHLSVYECASVQEKRAGNSSRTFSEQITVFPIECQIIWTFGQTLEK